jgi:hypothetical protein
VSCVVLLFEVEVSELGDGAFEDMGTAQLGTLATFA